MGTHYTILSEFENFHNTKFWNLFDQDACKKYLPFRPSTSIHVYTQRTEIDISDKTAFTFMLWHYPDIFFFIILKNWSWFTNRSLPSVWKTALKDGFIGLIILKLVVEMILFFKLYFPYLQFFNTFFISYFFIQLAYCCLLLVRWLLNFAASWKCILSPSFCSVAKVKSWSPPVWIV